MLQNIHVYKKCCSFELYIHLFTKLLGSTTVFNIDNNQKCFLSSKSVYYYDFWRSCDTEVWSNDAENSVLITEINYILTLYSHRKQIFHIIKRFHYFEKILPINAALVSRRDIHIFKWSKSEQKHRGHKGWGVSKWSAVVANCTEAPFCWSRRIWASNSEW